MRLRKKDTYRVAVAGAATVAGRELVEVLGERGFPVAELRLIDSEHSEGERVEFKGGRIPVRPMDRSAFDGIDITLFCCTPGEGRQFVPAAIAAGSVVIDASGASGSDPSVPLAVPEVNPRVLEGHGGTIACPNAATVAMAMVLKPLHDTAKLVRIVATTFHSVSGSGKDAMDELASQTVALMNFRDVETKAYPHQIAFNCIPQVGEFMDDGATSEERMTATGITRVLGADLIRVAVTAVRVPIFRCDAASLFIETERKLAPNEARALLAAMPGIVVYDDPAHQLYPLPVDVAGKDEVFVGRVREDGSIPNGLHLWAVSDVLRRGTALNAVLIAERLTR